MTKDKKKMRDLVVQITGRLPIQARRRVRVMGLGHTWQRKESKIARVE